MIVVGWEAYKVLRPFLSPNFTMTDTTDKKQQYLDAARALDALGDSALAEACRAKALSPPDPPKENPWIDGLYGHKYRISGTLDCVERHDPGHYGGSPWVTVTADTIRGLAKQLGMIDGTKLRWGAMGYRKPRDPAWVCDRDSKDDTMAYTASWAFRQIFQHLPMEKIK